MKNSVGSLSILCMVITLLVCLALPVVIALVSKAKYKRSFSMIPLLAGAAGFAVSQIIFRLPLVQQVLPLFGWYRHFMQIKWPYLDTAWPYLLFMCFTAGMVEEPARFIVFAILKKHRQFPDGISYGIGHGGIEAIYFVGLAMINNIVYSSMINSGAFGALTQKSQLLLQTQLNQLLQLKASLISTQPAMFLVGGVERIFTMAVHIALSLVVLRGFQRNKRAVYLILAIALHGFINLIPYYVQALTHSTLYMEATIGAEAVVALCYIIYCARRHKKERNPTPLPELACGQ